MGKEILAFALTALLTWPTIAAGAMVTATVVDQDGVPVADAVIALFPDAAAPPPPAMRLATQKIIDQRNETFIPLVTIVPKGGQIVFANNDTTKHQVYSFSAIKQFEITLPQGAKSAPFVFDKPGVAALGCNIHDHMIAYVYVAESPWTAITGKDGHVTISEVPDGAYEARLWHPRLPPARNPPSVHAVIAQTSGAVNFNVRLLPPLPMRMAHSHAANY
jgi:plastocyanin